LQDLLNNSGQIRDGRSRVGSAGRYELQILHYKGHGGREIGAFPFTHPIKERD
jgi:hypothetical protein